MGWNTFKERSEPRAGVDGAELIVVAVTAGVEVVAAGAATAAVVDEAENEELSLFGKAKPRRDEDELEAVFNEVVVVTKPFVSGWFALVDEPIFPLSGPLLLFAFDDEGVTISIIWLLLLLLLLVPLLLLLLSFRPELELEPLIIFWVPDEPVDADPDGEGIGIEEVPAKVAVDF